MIEQQKVAQLIFEQISLLQLIISNELTPIKGEEKVSGSTSYVTTYKVSSSNIILFDSKH